MDKDDVPSVVAGRYRITGPHQPILAKVSGWYAHDDMLDREVLVLFPDRDDPEEVLAAARRAATVTDTRFVKLLDVSRDASSPYIVIEVPHGVALAHVGGSSHSRADDDPQLSPDSARAVVGEVASALQVAARSGVRHLDLKPELVFIDKSSVHILGLGFAGALVDQDPLLEADTAARRDVLGLARLLEFLLASNDGEADAPTADQHALVTSVLEDNSGPATPREFAKALQPWKVSEISTITIAPKPEPSNPPKPSPIPVVRTSIHNGPSRDPLGSSTPGTPPPAVVPRPSTATRIPRPATSGPAPVSSSAPTMSAADFFTQPAAAANSSSQASPFIAPPPRGTGSASGKKVAHTPPRNLKEARNNAKRFRFNPTAAVLIIVLALVTWGTAAAFSNITTGLVPPLTLVSEKPAAPKDPAATPGTDGPTAGAPTTPEAFTPPVIAKGKQLDPDGDGNEHPEAVERAFDGDLQTAWFSRTYRSPSFGGISKSGIGYAIELEKSTQVSTMYLTTGNTGGKYEIRDTTAKAPSKGTLVASGTFSNDFTIKLSKPVVTKNLVLWVTTLPEVSTGGYGLRIYEISLS